MPMDVKRYPKDWKRIAMKIKNDADWKCQRCGKQCRKPGEPFDTHRRTLTVAHLNHMPEDCRPENLMAMCAPCHLRYDAQHHAETRRRKKMEKSNCSEIPNDSISRQAALKVACDTCQFVSCPDDDKCDEYEAMKNLPSAEPPYQYSEAYVKQIRAERDYLQELVNDMAKPKIGLWIRDDVGVITCSECGRPRRDNRINHIKYCNSCGARMRGW